MRIISKVIPGASRLARFQEDRSRRPKHLRQPTYSAELVEAALKLREEYPRWGKDKLVVLLRRAGFDCSTSTVGRILRKLKERGVLKEPVCQTIYQPGKGS